MMNIALNSTNEIMELPVDRILPNPYQPRQLFDRVALEELAASIRRYGLLQPVCVRMINGSVYELISGERRLRAAKLAGLKLIPAVLLEAGERESAALALVENLQRQELNYLEEAEAIAGVMKDFGCTQGEVAHILGKSQSFIAGRLRLLRLDGDIKAMLVENNLSERHARALLRLGNVKAQRRVLERVAKYGLNVKRTEELIDSTIRAEGEIGIIKKRPNIKLRFSDIRIFTNTIKEIVDRLNLSGVETTYEINKAEGEYEIRINIKTAGNEHD